MRELDCQPEMRGCAMQGINLQTVEECGEDSLLNLVRVHSQKSRGVAHEDSLLDMFDMIRIYV